MFLPTRKCSVVSFEKGRPLRLPVNTIDRFLRLDPILSDLAILCKLQTFEFFHNSCLIRQIQQKEILKKFRDFSRIWNQIACLAVRHLNHYTKLFSVLLWDCNSIIFMHWWFCPICLIHLIGPKSFHFEKNSFFLQIFRAFCTALWQHHCYIPHNVNKLPPLVIYLLMIPKIALRSRAYFSPHFEGTFGASFLISLNLVQSCEVQWYGDNQTPANDVFISWNSDKPDRICELFCVFVTENTQIAY